MCLYTQLHVQIKIYNPIHSYITDYIPIIIAKKSNYVQHLYSIK